MARASAFAAMSADTPLVPYSFDRREPLENDVAIDILFCGVCHSDLHTARGEWGAPVYPCVPGHEIVGRVSAVGSGVSKFKEGDTVGVGCLVDSCQVCSACRDNLEQFCETGMTGTYNAPDRLTGANTLGGYSTKITVRQEFVLRMPDGMDLAAGAPLLCAGITTYSPMRHWKVGPGSTVGIVGLGGLGHMGVKIAAALGAEVTLFTTSPEKVADGKRLGAHHVVISKDSDAMAALGGQFNFILDTVSASHDLNPYLAALKRDGTLVLVGAPDRPHPALQVFTLLMGRRSLAGSLIGGLKETQEMLDFCAEKGITSDIEMIRMDEIEGAYNRMQKGDVKYRFVIDMSTMSASA